VNTLSQFVTVNRLTLKNHHYLTSGVLESYLLGLVSNEDKEQLEHVLATDSDVLAELNELEAQMELYFLENGVPPPPGVKTAIEQRLSDTEITKWDADHQSHTQPPKPEPEVPRPNYIDVEVDNTHIRVHKHWRTAFIAVFILSKVFLILGLYYYFKADSQTQEIQRLKAAAQQNAPLPTNP
jgi:hypothetical protein